MCRLKAELGLLRLNGSCLIWHRTEAEKRRELSLHNATHSRLAINDGCINKLWPSLSKKPNL